MYSDQFMSYIINYQKEELKTQEKENKPCFIIAFLKSLFHTV